MGQIIAGRFELCEHIASGATGATWLAIDHKLGSVCAAKVLRHKDSVELLRFVREQGIRLNHPHLATPYGWAAEDHDVAIAMPLVCGGTLETALLDHGALTPDLTAALLLQLLDALQHVHEAGWLHRDVKPSNILLEATGSGRPHLRLGDFGTALRQDEPRLTQVGFIHGTPGYLSPESMGGAAPSKEADLYAAGIVALRMLFPTAKCDEEFASARLALQSAQLPESVTATILGLTSPHPLSRIDAARLAPSRLAPFATQETFRVANGEPFEVFDQIDPTQSQAERSPAAEALEPDAVPRPTLRTAAPLLMMLLGAALLALAILLAVL